MVVPNGSMVPPKGGGVIPASAPQGYGKKKYGASGETGATLGYWLLWSIGVDIGSEREDYPGKATIEKNRRAVEAHRKKIEEAKEDPFVRQHLSTLLVGPKL